MSEAEKIHLDLSVTGEKENEPQSSSEIKERVREAKYRKKGLVKPIPGREVVGRSAMVRVGKKRLDREGVRETECDNGLDLGRQNSYVAGQEWGKKPAVQR